jgi:hypothetical protein
MTTIRTQRGSIIVYALLTMSTMLAIGLTLSGLFIGKLRSASSARNSANAIYVADSAVEKCLFEARKAKDMPPLEFADTAVLYEIVGGDEGEPEADIKDDCESMDSGLFRFRATGIYRGVRRTLEITQ